MSKNHRNIIIAFIGIFLLVILISVPIALNVLKQKHIAEMERVISEKNGSILQVYKVKLEESPFLESRSGNVIYKIEYEVNGREHVAWYRGLKTVNNIHVPGAKDEEEKWIFE